MSSNNPINFDSLLKRGGSLLVILLIGLIALTIIVRTNNTDYEPVVTNTEEPDPGQGVEGYPPPLNPAEQQIEFFTQQLENENLGEQARENVEGRLEDSYLFATEIAELYTRTADRALTPTVDVCGEHIAYVTQQARLPPTKTPHPPDPFEGIFELGNVIGQMPGSPISTINIWAGVVDGINLIIWVGEHKFDREQGALYIYTGREEFPAELHLTPTKDGFIRVIAESNFQLTLEAEGGTIYYFDVPGRQFISALGDTVPTITPKPTLEREPTPLFWPWCITPPPVAATEQLPVTITPTWDSTGTPNYPTYTPTWAVTGTPDYPMTVTPEPTGYP